LVVPLNIAVLPLLWPILNRIRDGQLRIIKLLLSIPLDAIDETPSVKKFLETGERTSALERVEQSLEESNTRTQSILDACQDAVVVLDDTGMVQVFNTAASRMLGWAVPEVVGQSVVKLLPFLADGLGAYFESNGRMEKEEKAVAKDGSMVPIVFSLSRGETRSTVEYAAFLRDLRELHRMKELVEENESLFLSMVPREIGRKIKSRRAKGLVSGEKAVIASQYANVTVMFADICGFTAFSSKRNAAEIVGILN
jgi:PAS domain S-box-containing protein